MGNVTWLANSLFGYTETEEIFRAGFTWGLSGHRPEPGYPASHQTGKQIGDILFEIMD